MLSNVQLCSFRIDDVVISYDKEETKTVSDELAKEYRFGFQGQEEDDEIKGEGNSYDFGARIYDPRIGKFYSIDPKFQSFAFLSPYLFAQNDPISLIDENGESAVQKPPRNTFMIAFTGGPFGGGNKRTAAETGTTGMIYKQTEKDVKDAKAQFNGAIITPGATASGTVETAYDAVKVGYKKGDYLVVYAYGY